MADSILYLYRPHLPARHIIVECVFDSMYFR